MTRTVKLVGKMTKKSDCMSMTMARQLYNKPAAHASCSSTMSVTRPDDAKQGSPMATGASVAFVAPGDVILPELP